MKNGSYITTARGAGKKEVVIFSHFSELSFFAIFSSFSETALVIQVGDAVRGSNAAKRNAGVIKNLSKSSYSDKVF